MRSKPIGCGETVTSTQNTKLSSIITLTKLSALLFNFESSHDFHNSQPGTKISQLNLEN